MTDPPDARTELNRQTIRQAFDAWKDGTGAIADVFAPDMVWRIEGHSLASREYADRQQFVDEVLAPFGARFSASEPFRPVTIRSVHADGDTVIVLWEGRGIATDGRPYENSYAWFRAYPCRAGSAERSAVGRYECSTMCTVTSLGRASSPPTRST
jgi:uncharacterized protein